MIGTSALWVDLMTRAFDLEVAEALGRKTTPPKHASGGSIHGCPACGATIRHTKTEGDSRHPRGALGVRKNGRGWRCFQCDASGSGIDLVAYDLHGRRYRDLRDDERAAVREWCCRWLRIDGTNSNSIKPKVRPLAELPRAPIDPPPTYPPIAEVADLWDRSDRVDTDTATREYLRGRGLNPQHIADLDLARALPESGRIPKWAEPWRISGHKLLCPLFDVQADARSMLARSLDRGAQRKSLAPTGYARSGLSLMCPFARYVVRTAALPDWWPATTPLIAMVVEGEIDMLTASTEWSDSAELAPCVLGIVSGSWTPELAARVPDGIVLQIGTHADEQGERYARAILETVRGRRIEVRRWKPEAA